MEKLAELTDEIGGLMALSFNGVPVSVVREGVRNGTYGLFKKGSAYAIVSVNGNVVCIEAVEGDGGTLLAREIVEASKRGGFVCVAWVFNLARAKLAEKAGMKLTNEFRVGSNRRVQFKVST